MEAGEEELHFILFTMIRKAYKRFISDFKKLPERKQYIEFFTAILSVPVLLTVIILNINNLKGNDNKDEQMNTPSVREIIITQPSGKEITVTTAPCEEEIGPVSIANPNENEAVTDNPVLISVHYQKGKFCAVVWSYRINGGRWSDYDDKSIALYNPPQGNIKLDLRVKSVVTGDEKTLTRNFTYRGTSTVPTEPVASGSAQ
jgi:hypothetical protein